MGQYEKLRKIAADAIGRAAKAKADAAKAAADMTAAAALIAGELRAAFAIDDPAHGEIKSDTKSARITLRFPQEQTQRPPESFSCIVTLDSRDRVIVATLSHAAVAFDISTEAARAKLYEAVEKKLQGDIEKEFGKT
jgi:hypothetical protein